jgi:cysteine desulfurase
MIDLDQNATTPIDPEVLEAMRPHWLSGGNPESRHGLGRAARRALDSARQTIAEILNASSSEIVFTSGGSESNRLALLGLAGIERGPGHLLSTPIEHPAVSDAIAGLVESGYSQSLIPVTRSGIIDAERAGGLLRFDTRLATSMLANNETGAIQPVARLAAIAAELGLPTHTDAVQAVGRIPVDFDALGAATLAAAAHKFHGPIGVGCLIVRKGTPFRLPGLLARREARAVSGTPPVALAVGMAAALEYRHREAGERLARMRMLRDRLESRIVSADLGPIERNGPIDEAYRLPQTLNLAFPGVDANALLMQLDLGGVAASLGSACASGSMKPSPTLVAMGVPPESLQSSVRLSFGVFTTEEDIDAAAEVIIRVVRRIRESADAEDSSTH